MTVEEEAYQRGYERGLWDAEKAPITNAERQGYIAGQAAYWPSPRNKPNKKRSLP